MAKGVKRKKKASVSKKARAKTFLSPAFVKAQIVKLVPSGFRIGDGADVFLAGSVDGLLMELIKKSVEKALGDDVVRVQAKHVADALNDDLDLAIQLSARKGVIPSGRNRGSKEQIGYSDRKAPVDSDTEEKEPPKPKKQKKEKKEKKSK